MTRQSIKTIPFLFLFALPFLTAGQTKTADTLLFEKSYLKLKWQIDTTLADTDLRDSLFHTLDSVVINFFKTPTTFNYSFKILDNYSFLTAGQLRVLTVDARNGGSFHMTKTFIQCKGATGKIILKTIDGEASGATEDNLWYSNIYKLKTNLFLIVGNGTGCNSCFFYGARVFQIQGDNLLDYSAFGEKSFFTIDTDTYENIIFKFDKTTKTLIYDYTHDNMNKRTKGQYYFDGNKFIEK